MILPWAVLICRGRIMRTLHRYTSVLLLIVLCHTGAFAKTVRHYVFFNMERERITEESFLKTKAFEGAQLKYMWRELEPRKDEYDFSPDLMPFRQGQLNHSYPLIRETSGMVPTGVAVQDRNYADPNPANGKRATIAELLQFATSTLKVDYVFWCTEEPYYSSEVIPFLEKL